MSKDNEAGTPNLWTELRVYTRRGEDGEYLAPVGTNVLVEARTVNRDTGKVVQPWWQLGTRSISISVDAQSVTRAFVELPVVGLDMLTFPLDVTADVPQADNAETFEEKL